MIGTKNLRRAVVVAAATPMLALAAPALAASAATYTGAAGEHSAQAGAHGARVTDEVTYTHAWGDAGCDGGASYTQYTVQRGAWADRSGAGTGVQWSGTHAAASNGDWCGDGYGYGDDGYGDDGGL